MATLEVWLFLGGLVHVGFLAAGSMVPTALDFRGQLAHLTPFLRRQVWVYSSFVFLTVSAFALLSFAFAPELASGRPLARAIAGFIALFWIARLGVAAFVHDADEVATTAARRFGYHALTAGYVYCSLVYTAAAVLP